MRLKLDEHTERRVVDAIRMAEEIVDTGGTDGLRNYLRNRYDAVIASAWVDMPRVRRWAYCVTYVSELYGVDVCRVRVYADELARDRRRQNATMLVSLALGFVAVVLAFAGGGR